MRKGFHGARRRGVKARETTAGELPMVAALLIMAVVVALFAAGRPVLDMLGAFG